MRDLLSTREIALMYQVTSATVLNWIRAGKLKAYTTPGGHYRVAREDLHAFARAYSLPPGADAWYANPRLLVAGSDADFLDRLRTAVNMRWPMAQVEQAGTEVELGWWLARLRPTHIVVHPVLTPAELLDQCKQLAASDAARGSRLIALPHSLNDGLGEWINQIATAGV